jgi:ABC-2 type transport system ATP-binding protein
MLAIETAGLGKVYENGTLALKDMDLRIEAGKVFGLLGPNGAGKSTATRLLNGAIRPSAGSSLVLGRPSGDPAVRERTATMTETARMYEGLGVRENLFFFARMYGLGEAEARVRSAALLDRLGLAAKAADRLGALSTGQKKRVQLARCLMAEPELLFLDEPTSGLDPEIARETVAFIRELAVERGTTVLLCTHNLPLAELVCDEYGFIDSGVLRRSGSLEALRREAGIADRLLVRTTTGDLDLEAGPDPDINGRLAELMAAGRRIVEARRLSPGLEDLYFHYIKESNRGAA